MATYSGTFKKTVTKNPLISTATAATNAKKIANSAPTGGTLIVNSSGQVVPKTGTTTDPYMKTYNQYVKDSYGAYNTQYQNAKNNLANSNKQTNTTYNGLAKNIYNSYMQQRKNRQDLASNYGMTGGAVEQLNVGNENAYNRNSAYNEGLRTNALANNESTFNNTTAELLANYQKDLASAKSEARKSSYEAKDARAKYDLSYFQSTVSRYDTAKKCNKAIKKLKKSDPYYAQKKQMILAQKAVVKATKRENALKKQAIEAARNSND